jgi:hypothetical protein
MWRNLLVAAATMRCFAASVILLGAFALPAGAATINCRTVASGLGANPSGCTGSISSPSVANLGSNPLQPANFSILGLSGPTNNNITSYPFTINLGGSPLTPLFADVSVTWTGDVNGPVGGVTAAFTEKWPSPRKPKHGTFPR